MIKNSSTLGIDPTENMRRERLKRYYTILVHYINNDQDKKKEIKHQENHKLILALSDILQTVKCINLSNDVLNEENESE